MRRIALVAVAVLALCASAAADEQPTDEQAVAADAAEVRRDGFVWSGDACGASRYDHLVGEDYAELHQAALLPADSEIYDPRRLTTLEYKPGQLNFVLNGQGRIIAVGCF